MVDTYTQASCRSICNMVQTKLPRELRDMVYEYIQELDNVSVDCALWSYGPLDTHRFFGSAHGDHRCRCSACDKFNDGDTIRSLTSRSMWGIAPHVTNQDYVGAVFRDELMERWYKTKPFTIHNPASIESFTKRCMRGLTIKPAELVNTVEVLITDHTLFPAPIPDPDFPPFSTGHLYHDPNLPVVYPTDDIIKGIAHLSTLKTTCRITIRIPVWPRLLTRDLEAFMEALYKIFGAVIKLKSSGHNIGVVPSLSDDGMKVFRNIEIKDATGVDDWVIKVAVWRSERGLKV
jgi:hypothetical protein